MGAARDPSRTDGPAKVHTSCLRQSRFFFSSRRRHTRFGCDWSSDVCSSDLRAPVGRIDSGLAGSADARAGRRVTGRSEERRVGKSVDLGGGRIIKKKKKKKEINRIDYIKIKNIQIRNKEL